MVDLMAESYEDYSPYNYVFDSPLLWTDTDGRCPTCPQGDDAAAMYAEGAVATNQYGSWTWTGGNGRKIDLVWQIGGEKEIPYNSSYMG